MARRTSRCRCPPTRTAVAPPAAETLQVSAYTDRSRPSDRGDVAGVLPTRTAAAPLAAPAPGLPLPGGWSGAAVSDEVTIQPPDNVTQFPAANG